MNKNFPSQFCPRSCSFVGIPEVCAGCYHSEDKVFIIPEEIEVKGGGGWEQTKIIGRSGNLLYLEDKSTIGIDSNLIKL